MTNAKNRVTRFGLRNFKAFQYLEDIELRPLTVLVGANSTGKSSIFQSLLLLKQTSEASRFSGALKFDGDWTRLGNFGTVISNFDKSNALEYRFVIDFEISRKQLGRHWSATEYRTKEDSTATITGCSDIEFEFGTSQPDDRPFIKKFSVRTRFPENADGNFDYQLIISSETTSSTKNLFLYGANVSIRAASFDRFWPNSLTAELDTQSGPVSQVARALASQREFAVAFFPSLDQPLKILRRELEDRLEYLGPLRADPRPFYPIEDDPDIGLRGEGVIPYLLHHQHDLVTYIPGPSEEVQKAELLDAINVWLKRMNVTTRLTIDPLESIAYTATVQSHATPGKSVNLAQVGFGISQILPVLVKGLKSPSDAWLLLEQPEIHLHPRLQGELGDFLLCAARAGKTIMVETHSDHLVNRIRRRIAEDETGTLASMVQILFVHAGTPDNPSSYVEPLQVDESGTILNCPPDFFSEAPDEAFAILQAQRRKAQKAP
jgi:predicted ATPase